MQNSASDCSLLALDTAFDICSVAVTKPGISDLMSSHQQRKHADDVLPMIQTLLHKHQLSISSFDAIAMIKGPGSFTGLRIGTAVAQGLAFGAGLPIVCISSLAMLARSAQRGGSGNSLILVCLHARENEFYFAAYTDSLNQAPIAVFKDSILSSNEINARLPSFVEMAANIADGKIILAGGGWQHEMLKGLPEHALLYSAATDCNALLLAELAAHDYKAGLAVDAADASPVYLKDDLEYRTV